MDTFLSWTGFQVVFYLAFLALAFRSVAKGTAKRGDLVWWNVINAILAKFWLEAGTYSDAPIGLNFFLVVLICLLIPLLPPWKPVPNEAASRDSLKPVLVFSFCVTSLVLSYAFLSSQSPFVPVWVSVVLVAAMVVAYSVQKLVRRPTAAR